MVSKPDAVSLVRLVTREFIGLTRRLALGQFLCEALMARTFERGQFDDPCSWSRPRVTALALPLEREAFGFSDLVMGDGGRRRGRNFGS
jgi:hypothetical protein